MRPRAQACWSVVWSARPQRSTGSTTPVAKGYRTAVDSGATAAGSLVVAAMMTGGSPVTVTPGSSNGTALVSRIVSPSGALASADVLLSAPGQQRATFTLGAATDWYTASAVFRAGP